MKIWASVVALLTACTLLTAAGPAAAGATTATLKQLAEAAHDGEGILIGSAMRANKLSDISYRDRAATEFNLIAPESELTWEMLEGSRGNHNFTNADQLVAYAEANNQKVMGQHLAWHSAVPGWWPRGADQKPDPAAFTEEQARAMLKGHIETTMTHFRGRVGYWSVVNEALADSGTGLRPSMWQQTIGDEYIDEAFRWARAADPAAKLYINEYGTEAHGARARGFYDLVKSLLARGVPIDGVGFQTHRILSDGLSGFADVLRRFADLGLEIYITEVDVRIPNSMTSGAELEQQADVFGQVAKACLAVKACKLINFWGFTDRYSWISMPYPAWGRATLLTDTLAAKPAYDRVASVLSGWTPPAGGPAGWWRLDDWLPQGAAGGVASDASGNDQPAAAGTSLGCEGRSAGITAFCGDGVASQAVTQDSVVRTDVSFTVSAWVRLTDRTRDQVVVSQDGQSRAAFTLGYHAGLNKWVFSIPVADGQTAVLRQAVSDSVPATGVWTHLTAVWNRGFGQRMVLYVNGKWDISAPPTVTAWASQGSLRIGRSMEGASFAGGISDVRAYGRVLTDTEVASVADPAIARFRLNGNTGDSSWFFRDGSPRPDLASWVPGATPSARPVALALISQPPEGHTKAIDVRPRVLHTDRSYTVAAWVRLFGTPTGGPDMVAVAQDGEVRSAFRLMYLGSEKRWAFAIPLQPTGSTTMQIVKSSTLAGTSWTHLTAVFDADAGQIKLYVNGQLTSPAAAAQAWPGIRSLHLGQALEGLRFAGELNDVRIYQKALPDSDIQRIYAEPAG